MIRPDETVAEIRHWLAASPVRVFAAFASAHQVSRWLSSAPKSKQTPSGGLMRRALLRRGSTDGGLHLVAPPGIENDKALEEWLDRALAYVRKLPPKK